MKFTSPIITAGSGSIAGLTASRNKGGNYFRARAVPTNPNTTYQQAVRTYMAGLVDDWTNALTSTQRDGWAVYALNVPKLDALGNLIFLTGQQWYIACNLPRLQAGLASVDDAPGIYNRGSYTEPSFTIDTANDEVDVAFENSDAWANEDDSAMLVYASRPQNPSINYFKGPYRYADLIAGDGTTPPTSPAAITLPFPVAANQRIFLRVQVSRADGRLSGSFRGFGDAS